MTSPDQPLVLLIGMMGTGKTTVDRAIAARTGWRYVDNDDLLHAATGRTAPEIFAEDGQDALHGAESEALTPDETAAAVIELVSR